MAKFESVTRTERCKEMVADKGSSWPSFHQCTRKAEYGLGKLYCKQHALSHPDDSVVESTMWYGVDEWLHITRIVVQKKTDLYVWDQYGSRRAIKSSTGNYFPSLQEAYDQAMRQYQKSLQYLKAQRNNFIAEYDRLK